MFAFGFDWCLFGSVSTDEHRKLAFNLCYKEDCCLKFQLGQKEQEKEFGEIKRVGKLTKRGITITCSICKEVNRNKRSCPKNSNPKIKAKTTPEFAESQQSSTVNPKKRNRGDSEMPSTSNKSKFKAARSGYKKPSVCGT